LHGMPTHPFVQNEPVFFRKGSDGYREGTWYVNLDQSHGDHIWVQQAKHGAGDNPGEGFFANPSSLAKDFNTDDNNNHDTGNDVEYQNTAQWGQGD
jgi:hypothetical protein